MSNLSQHVKSVHEKSENVICSECNKSIEKQSLYSHIKTFHTEDRIQYNCKICAF